MPKNKERIFIFNEKIYELTCWKYFQDIVNGNIRANKWVTLLSKRMLDDLDKSKGEDFEYYFDYEKARFIEAFVSSLKFTEGLKVNEELKLAPFQNTIIVSQFCWRYKNDKTKLRFKDTIVFISRKNGKTYIVSLLSILAIMIEQNGEAVVGAGKLDQAKVMVRQSMNMISSNPKLAKQFKLLTNEVRFKGSTLKALPANPAKLDGINPHFVAMDEANIIDPALRNSLVSGGMMRKNVSNFYISTEYSQDMKTGWLDEFLTYSKKVLEGILENDTLLPFIYGLDNAEEVEDEENWIKANPILSEIDTSNLRELWMLAKESPSMTKNFLIKNMNLAQATASDDAYVDMDKWKACEVEKIDWKGIRVDVGIDLSKTMDLTAVSFTGIDSNGNVLVNSHGFLPEETLNKRQEMTDYRLMESLGHCSINEGAIIDYDFVIEYICNIEKKFGCVINSIQFDPFNAIHMMSTLSKKDFNCVEVRQNRMTLTIPTKTFREKVYTGMVQYEKNDLLAWCVSNAVESEDNNGNIALDKKKSKNRIDLIASVIFAYVETMKTKRVFDIDDYGIY